VLRGIQPGDIKLPRRSRTVQHQPVGPVVASQKHPTTRRKVLWGKIARAGHSDPEPSVHPQRPDNGRAILVRTKQELAAPWPPGDALDGGVVAGDGGDLPGSIHDSDRAAVVPAEWVVGKGDVAPVGGDAGIAEIARGPVHDLADGELEVVPAAHVVDDGQLGSVGRPVRLAHAVEHLSRGAAAEGHACQGPQEQAVPHELRADQHCQLAFRRHGEELGAGEAEGSRRRIVGPDQEDFGGAGLRGRAVDDGLTVGGEAGVVDRLVAESPLEEVEGHGSVAARGPAVGEGPECHETERAGEEAGPGNPARPGRGREDARGDGGRGPGSAVERHRELRGGREAVGRQLLQRGEHRRLDLGGDGVPLRQERARRLGQHPRHDRLRGAPGERRVADQHLVGDAAQRVDVGAGGDLALAHRLLRAHVGRRPERHAGLGHAGAAGLARGERDPEVGHQRRAPTRRA
jgi:hypothetical protein